MVRSNLRKIMVTSDKFVLKKFWYCKFWTKYSETCSDDF